MLETTMTYSRTEKFDGTTRFTFEWCCPHCHYVDESTIIDDDLRDGSIFTLEGECTNCDKHVTIKLDKPVEIIDYDSEYEDN